MESKDLKALSDVYLQNVYEDKKYGYDKDGNSLNPADIEERKKKDDDLAGSPNKNGDDKKDKKNGDDKKDKKNGKKKAKRWWDDDGDGKGYEKGEVKEAVYGKSPAQVEGERRKKDNLAGSPLVVTNADKKANTKAYQNLKAGVKGYKAADHLKNEEVELQEKQKDTPDQVKAVIAYDKARKGTDDATYDSEHGDKKQAKKERDYAKWQRDQGAEFAQKSGHPWEHAKGSTREKEGKKSVKHAHVKDSYDWQTESDLWDEVAEKLSELHELGGVKFKVVPFDLQEEENWIKGAVKRPGAFTKKAKAAGMSVQKFAAHVDKNKDKYSTRTEKQANLAQTFASMKKEGADFDALSNFLVNEGADDQAVNHIMANWLLEGEGHGVSLRGLHNDRARLKHSEIGSAREKELKTRIKDKETQMQQVQSHRWNPKTKKLEKNLGSRPHVSPEAQRNEGYQRNPEKGEAEERKAERDRKASGRMPPRGDKRREEFERWYAANVR